MTKEFNNLEEIQKYYDRKTNTYIFKEDNKYISLVVFNFDLDVNSDINAWNINACNINARDINVYDIDAFDINSDNIRANNIYANDINAFDISYCAVCYAYKNIKCISIQGRRKNAKHFVLDGVLEVEDKQ